MAWITLAIEVATEIGKNYLKRKEQEEASEALANKIIEAIKQELNSVKNDIIQKLNDLQKEELQGLVRGYLNNFELYKIGMPNEIDWLQALIRDANYLCGKIYVTFKRYLTLSDYYNSRDFMALYAPMITSYIYLLNELRIGFKDDKSIQISNTINSDILPGIAEFLELLEIFTRSRFTPIHETFKPEPKPDEKQSIMLLSYDVLDGKGGFKEINIVDWVKDKPKYRNEIKEMRDNAIQSEIDKVKKELGILGFVELVRQISDEIVFQNIELVEI